MDYDSKWNNKVCYVKVVYGIPTSRNSNTECIRMTLLCDCSHI